MKRIAKINAQGWLIIFLVALNMITLGFIWTHKPPEPIPEKDMKYQRERVHNYMRNHLNFSDAQAKEFRSMQQNHFKTMQNIQREIIRKKHELYSINPNNKESKTEIQNKLEELGTLYMQQEKITYEHINQVKSICLPEQMDEMDKMLNKIIFHSERMPRNRRMRKQIHN